MQWALGLLSLLALLVVVVPIAVYVGAFLVLCAWNLFSAGPALSRTGFFCPFSKRRVTVDFLTEAGTGQPSDVLSCSAFSKPYHVRCQKGCVALAEGRWVSTPMLPRFSLISGGTAYRPAGAAEHREGGGTRRGSLDRAV